MKRVVLTPTRLLVAAVVFGAASALAVWVGTYKVFRDWYGPALAPGHYPSPYVSPVWATPVATLIGLAAVGAVVLVLRRR